MSVLQILIIFLPYLFEKQNLALLCSKCFQGSHLYSLFCVYVCVRWYKCVYFYELLMSLVHQNLKCTVLFISGLQLFCSQFFIL